MCNIWTNEHTFTWSASTTDARMPDGLVCQCGMYRNDGQLVTKKLTWQDAVELAKKALLDAEARRNEEQRKEAKYWSFE